jgi:alpha-tubulin suppressor-like RCC1 family protein
MFCSAPAFSLTTPATGAVSAGAVYTVALKNDGTVWAWGLNSRGQLGDGTTTQRVMPVQVNGLAGVVAVASGDNHTLALKSDGTVWSWGSSDYGQLGDDTWEQSNSPVQVSGLTDVIAISAGATHSMALKSDGTVWGWGSNGWGELGDGTTDDQAIPVQVSGLTNVVAIAAGTSRTIALKSDGTVWTWGSDDFSEYGYIEVPTQVDGLTTIAGIAIADYHAVALKNDGTVWAWGGNYYGQLGNGTTTDSASPVQVSGLSGVVAVAANNRYTVALKSDGNLWAWGTTPSGLFGNTANIDKTLPTQTSGAANIVSFAAGRADIVAVRNDGAVLVWGSYSYGQVADGNIGRRSYPVQVRGFTDVTAISATTAQAVALKSDGTFWTTGTNQVQGITGAISAAAGYMHYVAVMSDGTVRSWGSNSYGEYGNNTTTRSSTPVTALNVSGIIAADAGMNHTLALKSDGTVLAWGYNGYGQLGDGTTTNRKTAVQVSGLTGVVAVSAGYSYSVALKSDGTVRKWGINGSIQIPGLTGITAISAGNNHLVALKSDGTVWTWGSNDSGQIGNGTFGGYASTAVQVSGLTGAVAVAAGGFHTVALKSDGTAWAWGRNTSGQLGDGTLAGRATAAQVAGASECVAICAGDAFTAVAKNNGTVWCWGNTTILGVDAPGTKQAAIRLIPSATDTDGDGMTDSWEMQYFGNLSHNGGADSDGDGLTDMQEFSLGSNPIQTNPDGDQFTDIADPYPNDYYNGVAPTLALVSGNQQVAAPGQFNTQPFVVSVKDAAGTTPLVGTPVSFVVQSGGGQLALTNTGSPTLSGTIAILTDTNGLTQVYYQQPAASGASSTISAIAGNAQVSFSTTSQAANLPPVVELTAPQNGSVFTASASILLTASASDPDGTIAKVEFYQGETKLGESTSAPFEYSWSDVPVGSYVFKARTYDNSGAFSESATVSAVVSEAQDVPVVELISPVNGAHFSAPATINMTATASSAGSGIDWVDFYIGNDYYYSSGSPYEFTWRNVPPGTYTLKARAYDLNGSFADSLVSAIIIEPPRSTLNIVLVAPQEDQTFSRTDTIELKAEVGSSTTAISRVEFYRDNSKIGEANIAPYQYVWTGLSIGDYSISARVYDSNGSSAVSTTVLVHVVNSNILPSVVLTSPASDSQYSVQDIVQLAADASDDDGNITKVEFYQGTKLIGYSTTSPYTCEWRGFSSGEYSLKARAYDNLGDFTDSSIVPMQVTGNLAPVITLAYPKSGLTYASGATAVLQASASDQDGWLTRVEFIIDGVVVGAVDYSEWNQPSSFSQVSATLGIIGEHSLVAKAYDNMGASTDSESVTISITSNHPPAVSLAVTATEDGKLSLSASASDTDGVVTKVAFFAGDTKLGEAAVPPYVYLWENVPPGEYLLSANAYDDAGGVSSTLPFREIFYPKIPYVANFEIGEGFLNGALSGQKLWNCIPKADTALVSGSDFSSGLKSVVLQPESSRGQLSQLFSTSTDQSVVFVDFFAKPVADNELDLSTAFFSESAEVSLAREDQNGVIYVYDRDNGIEQGQGWVRTECKLKLNSDDQVKDWSRFTFRMDYAAHRWDLYVNGRIVKADMISNDSTMDRFSLFSIQGHSLFLSRFDNLFVGCDNPLFIDADSDGMDDAWEVAHGLDPTINDRDFDPDSDLLTNIQEYVNGSDPHNSDTDGDGLPDGWEIDHSMKSNDANDAELDYDNDGLTNLQEFKLGSDPRNPMSLVENVIDGSSDDDGDGVTLVDEIRCGTDPNDYYNGMLPNITPLYDYSEHLGPNGLLAVKVTDVEGRILAGAPISFHTFDDSNLLTENPYGRGKVRGLQIHTDEEGIARVYVRPSN